MATQPGGEPAPRTAADELEARYIRDISAEVLAHYVLDDNGQHNADGFTVPDDTFLAAMHIGARGVVPHIVGEPGYKPSEYALGLLTDGFNEAASALKVYGLNQAAHNAAKVDQERSRRRLRTVLGGSAVAAAAGLALIPTHSAAVFAPAELILIGSAFPAVKYYDCKHRAAILATRTRASLGVIRHLVAPVARDRQHAAAEDSPERW